MTAVRCRTCNRSHAAGIFSAGDRVMLTTATPRADGLQRGTKGKVVAWVIAAGAAHQEVHVQRKGGRVAVFAPCELAAFPPAPPAAATGYHSITAEDFKKLLRARSARVSIVSVTLDEMKKPSRRPAMRR